MTERESLFHDGLRASHPELCCRLVAGKRICIAPRGHDKGLHEPKAAKIAEPRKTKAQLETEVKKLRTRNRDLERSNSALRRAADPPDYSYFGLGDGPT